MDIKVLGGPGGSPPESSQSHGGSRIWHWIEFGDPGGCHVRDRGNHGYQGIEAAGIIGATDSEAIGDIPTDGAQVP